MSVERGDEDWRFLPHHRKKMKPKIVIQDISFPSSVQPSVHITYETMSGDLVELPDKSQTKAETKNDDPLLGLSSAIRRSCVSDWKKTTTRLGGGAFGDVYQACKLDDCDYALKISDVDTLTERKSFEREVSLLQTLSTTNIAPKIYDSWICPTKEGYEGAILMEKLDGNFTDLISQLNDPIQKVNIVDQLITKVKSLAGYGIYHMDLKPENILYKRAGTNYLIYIADYGVVEIVEGEITPTIKEEIIKKHYDQISKYIFVL